jgi:hypothetical protein
MRDTRLENGSLGAGRTTQARPPVLLTAGGGGRPTTPRLLFAVVVVFTALSSLDGKIKRYHSSPSPYSLTPNTAWSPNSCPAKPSRSALSKNASNVSLP